MRQWKGIKTINSSQQNANINTPMLPACKAAFTGVSLLSPQRSRLHRLWAEWDLRIYHKTSLRKDLWNPGTSYLQPRLNTCSCESLPQWSTHPHLLQSLIPAFSMEMACVGMWLLERTGTSFELKLVPVRSSSTTTNVDKLMLMLTQCWSRRGQVSTWVLVPIRSWYNSPEYNAIHDVLRVGCSSKKFFRKDQVFQRCWMSVNRWVPRSDKFSHEYAHSSVQNHKSKTFRF